MSHFAILVIGDNIEKQLQPYHEYECTGEKDKYVIWVDETEEKEKEFNTESRTMLIDFDGNIKDLYDDEFYREPTSDELKEIGIGGGSGCTKDFSFSSKDWKDGLGYRPKISYVPDNYMKKEISYKKIYGTIEKWLEDWEGYDKGNFQNGQIGRWTNPNAKWDWYQIGGRYRGRLQLKETTPNLIFQDTYQLGFTESEIINFVKILDENPEKFKIITSKYTNKCDKLRKFCKDISKSMKEPGFPSHILSEKGWSSPDAEPGQADQALKKDIDFSKIHQTKEGYDKAIRFWEMKIEGVLPETNEDKEQMKWDWYKKEYYIKRYHDKETYAKCCSNFTMWGYVKDGKWHEKGNMGWFGFSGESDKDALKWELEFYDKVIKSLPEDTLLTVVDCHI